MASAVQGRGVARRRLAPAGLAWALLAVGPVAAQTRAGTAIANVAALRQDMATVPSNPVVVTVAERLDLTLTPAALQPGTGAVALTLVNRGNGDERFAVVAAITAGGATLGAATVAVAGGAPMPLVDGCTPPLAPGAVATLLVPVSTPGADAVLTVSARAATGSGAPGTVVAGQGDGGGDAVVGATGAAASVAIPLAAAPDGPVPTLTKSQSVAAPDGSAAAVRGARIDYTLVARFAAAASDAAIVDPLPAGTAYVAGSLTLDGRPIADAGHVAPADAPAAGAGTLIVTVPLGTVAAGAVRTLRFTVVIA